MFDILQYPFIQNAFIASTFVAIIAAIVGYFLIIRGLTFIGHALSHIGFAGAAGAVMVGLDPVYGLLLFTTVSGLSIGLLGKELRERDITIGIILTLALGFGALFISLYTGYAEQVYSILFGTILGISRADILITASFSLAAICIILVLFRPLLFSSFDPEVAEARGVPVKLLSIIFLIMVAVTVSLSVQVVGVLLIFTLLVGPAASAIRIVQNPLSAIGLAIILSVCYTWLGIILAINTNLPVTFFISALSFGLYIPIRLFWKETPKKKQYA